MLWEIDQNSVSNALEYNHNNAVQRAKDNENGVGVSEGSMLIGETMCTVRLETTYKGNWWLTLGLSKLFGIKQTKVTMRDSKKANIDKLLKSQTTTEQQGVTNTPQKLQGIASENYFEATVVYDKGKGINELIKLYKKFQQEHPTKEDAAYTKCSNLARSLTNKVQSANQAILQNLEKAKANQNNVPTFQTPPLNLTSANLSIIANIIDPKSTIESFSSGGMARDLKNETSGNGTLADKINKDLDLALSQKLITQEEKQEILETAISGLQAGIETLKKLNLSSDKESDYTNALKRRIDTLQTELNKTQETQTQ